MDLVLENNDDNLSSIDLAEIDTVNPLVQIKVNGVMIEVTEQVKVEDLLIIAKKARAISGEIKEYIIERVEEEGEKQREEIIIVKEQEEFLAVPVSRTEVASCM